MAKLTLRKVFGFSLTALIFVFAFACREAKTDLTQQPVYLRLPKALLSQEFVKQTDFNRDHKQDDTFAFGYMSRVALAHLSDKDFAKIVELDPRYSRADFDAKTLRLLDDTKSLELGDLKEGYHDYEALTAELENVAAANPEIASLESAGKSVGGRELWLMKLSDNASTDENEPKLLYIANMHGDEVVGREMMVYLIRKLTSEYGTNQKITDLVNNAQIYIMPSMNPDGFEDGGRANGNGYDLNRNFPDFSADPDDTSDGRQVETKAIMDLHAKHHFLLAINFHGGAVCFNLPWDTIANGTESKKFGDDPLIFSLGRTYADANATMSEDGNFDRGVTYGYEWYEVDGGMQDWSSYYRNSIHATVELSTNKWPSADQLTRFWQENEQGLVDYLVAGIRGAHLQVVDTDGSPVQNVNINIASTARRTMTYPSGVIHRPTLPGRQTVKLSAPGFQDAQFDIEALPFSGQWQEITLQR